MEKVDVSSRMVGRDPKEEALGIRNDEKIMIGTAEAACNPIVHGRSQIAEAWTQHLKEESNGQRSLDNRC